jgi:hypothetical protein
VKVHERGGLGTARPPSGDLTRGLAALPGGGVVVIEVMSEDAPQVTLVHHDHMIEALPPDAADQSLHDTNGFCHGDRAAMTTCSMPMRSTRREKR